MQKPTQPGGGMVKGQPPQMSNKTTTSGVQLRLTKAEQAEFQLSSSFDLEGIELLREAFERMQCAPVEHGKVSFHEFCLAQSLKTDQYLIKFRKVAHEMNQSLKEEHLLSRKLFEKLDMSRDGYLNFFDLLHSLDGANQREFKSRLKFYFELFCESDKKIITNKMMKMQREIGDMFPWVVVPQDYWLGKSNPNHGADRNPPIAAFGSRRGSVDDQKEEEGSLKLSRGEGDDLRDAEEVGLDDFYDHIDKVYGALS